MIEAKPGVQPAVSMMRDGRIWFSTIRGLLELDPNILLRNIPPPPVVIEEVTVNGQKREARRKSPRWLPPSGIWSSATRL